MSKIYAVAMDSFCNGVSIRNSYTMAYGPYDDKETAEAKVSEAIEDLAQLYKSIETKSRIYKVKEKDDGTKFLLVSNNGNWSPVARYTVFEIDTNIVTDYKATGVNGYFKKGTAAQMAYKKKLKKSNQYISALIPPSVTKNEIDNLILGE